MKDKASIAFATNIRKEINEIIGYPQYMRVKPVGKTIQVEYKTDMCGAAEAFDDFVKLPSVKAAQSAGYAIEYKFWDEKTYFNDGEDPDELGVRQGILKPKMKRINENTKVTLTLGQLKRLVKESMEYLEEADKLDQVKRCLIRAAWDDSFNYDGDEAARSVEDFYTIRIVEKGTRLPDYIKGIEKAFETYDWVYVIEGEKAERGSGETSLSFFAADDALEQNYKVLEHGWEDRMTMYWIMVDKTDIDG